MKPEVKLEESPCSVSDESPPQRPKRNTCQKNLGNNNGILWREETELKRALYASLQESRRRNFEDEGDLAEGDKEKNDDPNPNAKANCGEVSPKKARVHAQRKFAQGSTPNSPLPTPLKVNSANNSASELLPCRRPKTEDFLTFLCLRGTTILPPSFDFLNTCCKSDTSSDSRCESPDLEICDPEPVTSKTEYREKNHVKHEATENGISRKHGSKASTSHRRTEPDVAIVEKKHTHSNHARSLKEVPRKRKTVDDDEFIPNKISSSKSGSVGNHAVSGAKGRLSMGALREKYKQQRLATHKKKPSPPAPKNTQVSPTVSTRHSQTRSGKQTKKSAAQMTTRNRTRNLRPIISKTPRSRTERKLALEKKKSLRSANPETPTTISQPNRSYLIQRRSLSQNKNTPWLRRAKLVPPIVDVDSESEPEVITTIPASDKKPKLFPSKVRQKVLPIHTKRGKSLAETLRNRRTAFSKAQSKVCVKKSTLRERACSQQASNKKFTSLRNKYVKSKTIMKSSQKNENLKKLKKSFVVLKTMSLRNDPKISKRVTRSAAHVPEELTWTKSQRKMDKGQQPKSNIKSLATKPDPSEDKGQTLRKKTNPLKKVDVKLSRKSLKESDKSPPFMRNHKVLSKVEESIKLLKSDKKEGKKQVEPIKSISEKSKILQLTKSPQIAKSIIQIASSDDNVKESTKLPKSKQTQSSSIKESGVKTSLPKNIKDSKRRVSPASSDSDEPLKPKRLEEKNSQKFQKTNIVKEIPKHSNGNSNQEAQFANKCGTKEVKKINKIDISKGIQSTNKAIGNVEIQKTNKTDAIKETQKKQNDSQKVKKVESNKEVQKINRSTTNKEVPNINKTGSNKEVLNVNTTGTDKEVLNINKTSMNKEAVNSNRTSTNKEALNINKTGTNKDVLNINKSGTNKDVLNINKTCVGKEVLNINKTSTSKEVLNINKPSTNKEVLNINKTNTSKEVLNINMTNTNKEVPNINNISANKEALNINKTNTNKEIQKVNLIEANFEALVSSKTNERETCKLFGTANNKHTVEKKIRDKPQEVNRLIKTENEDTLECPKRLDHSETQSVKTIIIGDVLKVPDTGFISKQNQTVNNIANELQNQHLNFDDDSTTLKKGFSQKTQKAFIDIEKQTVLKNDFRKEIQILPISNCVTVESEINKNSITSKLHTIDCVEPIIHETEFDKKSMIQKNFYHCEQNVGKKSVDLGHKSHKKDNDKDVHKSGKNTVKDGVKIKRKNSDSTKTKKDGDKEHQKIKKELERESSKSKSHDKESLKTGKKDEKDSSKTHRKEKKSKSLKEIERECLKSSKKEGDKDKSKHSRKESCSSGSKSSKRDSDRESSKSSKKESDRESSFSESKKDKSSKKISPKKKKKHEHKDFDKITKSFLFSDSSIMSKFPEFKEFKKRSSEEKAHLKKLISKSKKRKKLQMLKAKKLSKKISSKLLNKYSKKKGLKSKKNKLKLKKKELRKEGSSSKSSSQSEKSHSKTKKQKHKNKSDHHRRDSQDKNRSGSMSTSEASSRIKSSIVGVNEISGIKCKEEAGLQAFTSTTMTTTINVNDSVGTSSCVVADNVNDTAAASSYIIENMSEGVAAIDAMTGDMAHTLPGDLVFGATDDIQSLMTSEFSGVFDEAFTTGAILLTTRDTLSQVPLHFIQDIAPPKTMADAATNTSEDDLMENLNQTLEPLKSEETSVGTQTMTPVGSPAPRIDGIMHPSSVSEIKPVSQNCATATDNPVAKSKPKIVQKTELPTSTQTTLPLPTKKRRSFSVMRKNKLGDVPKTAKEPFPGTSANMVDAPVYHPTLEEFQDPLEYICKIQPEAGQYGICKIVPPTSFKPECKVNDDMRFTAHNQYVHKMLYRWGPNVQHVTCIKKHLKSQKVQMQQAPLIGGIELDLSKFYNTVQQFGGLQQVIEKKKWQRVADVMHIPKAAQDRVTKLYDAYCKYLVSYETLPVDEKKKLEDDVIAEHEKKAKLRNNPKEADKDDDDGEEEENYDCVSKGRSMSLSSFYRVARNTMSVWHKNETSPEEVEHEFWKLVTDRKRHVVVHAGNIDSSVYQSGFPCHRNSPFAKHPWNLKILTNNINSILRCMGPVSGITIPTLHVGMLFTTGCWYRDPHSLPWIEYLHTGASKIWYGIPAKGCEKFRQAMKKIMPECCTSNPIWLPSDTAMVPPDVLVKNGASLSRTVQHSGQFIVIFPESFTSTICSGYCVSESVYFAPPPWLDLAQKAFQDIRDSCEPPAFSLERLLFSIANDSRTLPETLQKIQPMIGHIRKEELRLRKQLNELGLKISERLPLLEVRDKKKKSRGIEDESEQECEVCRTHCYVSMVVNSQEDSIYCLHHAVEHIQKKKNLKFCKLMYTYDEPELNDLVKRTSDLIAAHLLKCGSRKKSPKKRLLAVSEK